MNNNLYALLSGRVTLRRKMDTIANNMVILIRWVLSKKNTI